MKANCVIIGGGISGLSIAYNLAKLGMDNIVLVEKSYLGSGSTGKCGRGVRQQFTTREHIVLMRESVKLWENLSRELGREVYFRQGGYLWLLRSEDEVKLFKENIKFQNSFGVPSRLLSVEEAKEIVPQLNEDIFIAAAYCHTDGTASPFDTIEAYAEAATRLGVKIYKFTEAKRIIVENGKVKGVETSRGTIESPIVVNAAGYGAKKLAKTAGVDLPLENYRHHIMVTEPLKQFLKPMVIYGTLYFNQDVHGNLIGGIDLDEKPTNVLTPRIEFLAKFARNILKVMPVLGEIKVLRQWAGFYVVTPDHHPILGEVDEVDGLYLAVGYSGHGFMMGPIVGKVIAELIVKGKPSVPIDTLNLRRFKEGKLIYEKAIIG